MSNTIRDLENLNARQLQTAERRHKRDLRAIDDSYQDLKAELKNTQATEVVDIQQEHLRTIQSEQAKKEKVLAQMKGHLEETSRMTDKELADLKRNADVQKEKIAQNLSIERERQITNHQLYLEDENGRFNSAIRDVNAEGKARLSEMKIQMNGEIQELDSSHQNKLNTKKNEFAENYKRDELAFEGLKNNQEKQFANARQKMNLTQQRELSKLTDEHARHLGKEEQTYRTAYKDQGHKFEDKFEQQLKTQEASFHALKAKNDSLLNGLKESLSNSISLVSQKHDDPFYQFETLSPKLKEFSDRVEIAVAVPEHAKQDVQLTTNGKEAIISFNRRFQDATKSEAGVINKVSKVESFSTRLPTDHVLNPKSVKSQYEDGVMTFTVKKA